MGRVIVEQIISADGFAADSEGGMKFMAGTEPNDPHDGQIELLDRVDAIVLGRNTYGMFAEYWPEADASVEPIAISINALPKHVVSNTLTQAPWGDGEIEIESGDGVTSVLRLRDRYAGDVIVWGSLTLTDALLRAGAVDTLRLRIVPTFIGTGRGATPDDLPVTTLTLTHSVVAPSGVVTLEYALGR